MFDKWNRPNWNAYFMYMCCVIAQRSLDPSTKHGAVCIDDENNVLSMGYNSPPQGCSEEIMPKTRPLKYLVFLHAEENCIMNAARNGVSLKGGIIYATGLPCARCTREMIRVGIKRVVYGNVASVMLDNLSEEARNEEAMRNLLIAQSKIDMVKFDWTDSMHRFNDHLTDYFDKYSDVTVGVL